MVLRKVYFFSLVALAFACALFAVPMVRAEVLQVAQGAGRAVLLPLPTLLLVWLAALPAMLRWDRPDLRAPLFGLGAIAAGVLLVLPGLVADRALALDLAAQDDMPAAPFTRSGPIGIEMHRNIGAGAGPYDAALHGPAPCTPLCERLLMGGDVAWVRMILRNDHIGEAPVQKVVLLTAAEGQACQNASRDFAANSRCVLFGRDHGARADITLRLTERRLKDHAYPSGLYQPIGLRQLAGSAGPDGATLFQQTRIFHRRPTIWLTFDITRSVNGDAHRGVGLLRSRTATPALGPEAAMTALGIALGAQPAHNRAAQDAAYVASLLATGPQQGAIFSRALGRLVDGWHAQLFAQPGVSEGDAAIFCATARDRRLPGGFWKAAVMTSHQIACEGATTRAARTVEASAG